LTVIVNDEFEPLTTRTDNKVAFIYVMKKPTHTKAKETEDRQRTIAKVRMLLQRPPSARHILDLKEKAHKSSISRFINDFLFFFFFFFW
jgi:hypothetical protein